MAQTYTFRDVTTEDISLIASWRAAPHVREWWGDDEPATEMDLGDPRVTRCIVVTDHRPFAYMQDYDVHGWEDHPFAHLPPGARGIDQFIGRADMVERGHGTGFVAARCNMLFKVGAPMIATDPDPDNARAIHVYQKVGFRISGSPRTTPWGRILPMTLRR